MLNAQSTLNCVQKSFYVLEALKAEVVKRPDYLRKINFLKCRYYQAKSIQVQVQPTTHR